MEIGGRWILDFKTDRMLFQRNRAGLINVKTLGLPCVIRSYLIVSKLNNGFYTSCGWLLIVPRGYVISWIAAGGEGQQSFLNR